MVAATCVKLNTTKDPDHLDLEANADFLISKSAQGEVVVGKQHASPRLAHDQLSAVLMAVQTVC